MNESITENETLEISKSQRKREANELLELAKNLIAMPESRLKRMPMEQELRMHWNLPAASSRTAPGKDS